MNELKYLASTSQALSRLEVLAVAYTSFYLVKFDTKYCIDKQMESPEREGLTRIEDLVSTYQFNSCGPFIYPETLP